MQEPTLLTGALLGTEDHGDIVIRSACGDLLYRLAANARPNPQSLEEVLSVCRTNALAFYQRDGRTAAQQATLPAIPAATQDILISPSVCGLQLRRSVLEQLFDAHPELFGEPHPLQDLAIPGMEPPSPEKDECLFANALVKGELVYFLDLSAEVRTCPWLLAKWRTEGTAALTPPGSRTQIKIVSIPGDVKWYTFIDDDGSEHIREQSRSWE